MNPSCASNTYVFLCTCINVIIRTFAKHGIHLSESSPFDKFDCLLFSFLLHVHCTMCMILKPRKVVLDSSDDTFDWDGFNLPTVKGDIWNKIA